MPSFLLRGGLVFDGSGRPPSLADVLVREGRIAAIGNTPPTQDTQEIDATGLWVCPGFVDIHTHYDLEVEVAPGLPESVRHGVTSVVMGNCSLSLALGRPQELADLFLRVETLPSALVHKWLGQSEAPRSPETYLAALKAQPLGANVAVLLGHSALRAHVMGLARSLSEPASPEEIAAMVQLTEQAFALGFTGLSVDRVHWHKVSGEFNGSALPSHHASHREVRALAEVCRQHDRVFQVTPNPAQPSSALQILALCPGLLRAPLRCTVLSALDMDAQPWLWRTFGLCGLVINRLLGGNLRFQSLPEPFQVWSDGPLTPLFEEFSAGVELNNQPDASARKALWRAPDFRTRFRRDWTAGWFRGFHRNLSEMQVTDAPDAALAGRNFTDIASERGADPLDTFMDLLAEYDDRLQWTTTGANRRPWVLRRLLANPHILPGFSDAGAHCRNLAFQNNALTLLREAVQSGFMTPERAIQRVTSEPAEWFQVDAGRLQVGARADLVLLDPERLTQTSAATASYADPLLDGAQRLVRREDEGVVRGVWTQGVQVVHRGVPTSALGREPLGKLLCPRALTQSAKTRARNRITDELVDHPFETYWEVFVMKHRDRANVALHVMAVLMLDLAWILAVGLGSPWPLWLLPLSQVTGLLGHVLFERSYVDPQDAIFSPRALLCLHRMTALVLLGRYFAGARGLETRLQSHETERLQGALQPAE